MDICPKCGLPQHACVCEEIAKQEQKINIGLVKRKYGKYSTVVSGFGNDVNIKDIAKELKSELACGGTVKNNAIELQGDHKKAVTPILIRLGFSEDSITQ
ncbi:MAG: translation initiation factor [Nanoarchaeota archaeon]|nr:translation initiation factor [Nanoarchaeota archaeon]